MPTFYVGVYLNMEELFLAKDDNVTPALNTTHAMESEDDVRKYMDKGINYKICKLNISNVDLLYLMTNPSLTND